MSSLKYVDRQKLEKLFGMSGGYLMDFSNRTFRDFFLSIIKVDIYDGTDGFNAPSKANLLRSYWDKADDYHTGLINRELLSYWYTLTSENDNRNLALYNECVAITDKQLGNAPVQDLDALSEAAIGNSLEEIVSEIKRNIEDNNPHLSLDRLHTYMMVYCRGLCSKHKIEVKVTDTLNSLFGKYNKWIHENNVLESKISSRIIGNSINVLEDFNYVRNNQSAAHPNPILNKTESIFIVDSICSLVKFINAIELVISPNLEQDLF